jgi:hypothetical protein
LTVGFSTTVSAAFMFNRIVKVYTIHFDAVRFNELIGQFHGLHRSKIKGSGRTDEPAVRLLLEGSAINRVLWS